MSEHWEKVWEFRTNEFRVVFACLPDDDLDLSWDDDGSVRKGLENGTYVAFEAHIAVYFRGEVVGESFLGSCIYEQPEKFIDHRGNKQKYGSYFHDMTREAIAEARKTLTTSRPYIRQSALG
jgi:hypothetical protein